MKKNHCLSLFRTLCVLFFLVYTNHVSAQDPSNPSRPPSNFWENVQFGGGIGLNFSSGYTDIYLAPSAIYNLNPIVALGGGLNYNYVASRNYFSSSIYGFNTIILVNPIPEIQLSIAVNQSRVNYKEKGLSNYSENYWDTDLILGVGYRTGNVTIGVGYNVLQNDRFNIEPFVPFVRAYF